MKKYWGIFALATIAMFLVAACGAAEDAVVPTAIAPQAAATAVPAAAPAAAADPASPLAPQGAVDPAAPVGIAAATATPFFSEIARTIHRFDPKGVAVPTSFNESPVLAAKVAAGELPRVQSRLPREPFVHLVVDRIGEYGGTWRRGFTGPRDGQNYDRINHDQFSLYDSDNIGQYPYMAKTIDVEDDRIITMALREGLRWSDGKEFTADDITFAIGEITYNEELNPNRNKKMGYSSFAPVYEQLDKYTVRWTLDEPSPAFLDTMPGCCGWLGGWNLHGRTGLATFAPAHFLKQFHPDFTDRAEVLALAKSKGFEDWQTYFKDVGDSNRNPDVPSMSPWNNKTSIAAELWELERNPYFFSVDAEGNQLPYIDKISMELIEDIEIFNLKGIAGEFDFQARHIVLGKLPVLLQNQDRGNFRMVLKPGTSFHEGITFNQTWTGDTEIEKWIKNLDFRIAVSLSIDRAEIKEVLNLGLGDIGNAVPPEGHQFYMGPEWEFKNAEFDRNRANKILDDLGLTEKDGAGYRLRSDGSGKRLSFDCVTLAPYFTDTEGFVELVETHTASVGLEFKPRVISRGAIEAEGAGNQIAVECLSGGINYSGTLPPTVATPSLGLGVLWGDYLSTDGAEGTQPPPDVMRLHEIYLEAQKLAYKDRGDLLKEAWQLYMTNMFGFNTVKNAPSFLDTVIVKKNFFNVLENATDFNQWPGEIHPDQFFFAGGKNDAGF